jgi:hypothetical protein
MADNHKCPKCNGLLVEDYNQYGPTQGIRCVNCGLTSEEETFYDVRLDIRRPGIKSR